MDIRECLKNMTLEEKVLLLEGADKGFTNPVKRLGIPRILLADGPHGVRVEKGTEPDGDAPYTMTGEMEETTAFPCEAAMAATWDAGLLEKIGRCMGEECRALGVGVLLGPGVNGKRSPLGGRNFEYFSEDPYLSGKLAAALIRGVQSQGVGTCLKHYALNDQESRRTSVNVHIDERAMWEIYLKPFEIAIREAAPFSVMAAYNKVDGHYMSENEEMLAHILRERLGFPGAVVSDWGAVHDKVSAVKAGLSLQMPGPGRDAGRVIKAVEDGELTEAEIDRRAGEVLRLVKKVTEARGKKQAEPDWQEHHRAAVQTAAEGMVLLKNEDGILPLKQAGTLAVLGELAEKPCFVGGGSSSLTPRQMDMPLECLGGEYTVSYAKGYAANRTTEELLNQAVRTAGTADTVLLFAGVSTSESLDRDTILLPREQIRLVRAAAAVNPNIVLVTQCGSAVDYSEAEKYVKAILHVWIPGEGFGAALAAILSGRISPCGKLAETFPVCLENTPAYPDFPGVKDEVYYREGLLTGYRFYDTRRILPRYPFGFGLSYTTFALENLRLSSHRICSREELTVSVDVKNTGSMAGKEVVQLYIRDEKSAFFRPEKELKEFAKVKLEPGETKTVVLKLTEDAFSYYVPHLGRFAVESGSFAVLAGTSSRDICLEDTVEVISEDEVRLPLGMTDSFKDFLEDDRYTVYARQFLAALRVDESHMFYQMLLGVNLIQMQELLAIMGIDEATAGRMTENLINRQSEF
ncbi:beta-glucosidase family protein [Marvinbryantia formatexigens]|nr:glycoside hydrolase family 3 C-terminal domain-containing protein [Marvinbryantia formatexigens]